MILRGHLGKEDTEGKEAVCKDACAHDYQASWDGPVPQQVWVIWLELAFGVIIRKAHKASQWNGSYRIFHLRTLHVQRVV